MSRDKILEALNAEGIPASKGIQRLLSQHPNIKNKIAWGSKNLPWSLKNKITWGSRSLPWGLKIKPSKLNNQLTNCNILFEKSFLGFYQLGWPTSSEDIDQIIFAFEKIFLNLDKLK